MDRAGTHASGDRRQLVAVAGHRGDVAVVRAHLADPDPAVRTIALGALDRTGDLRSEDLTTALGDDSSAVRRRAVELAATRPGDQPPDLVDLLDDPDQRIVEVAAWALGEQEPPNVRATAALRRVVAEHDDSLCREAAVASLGAIGDEEALPTILAATRDIATVRRRAVIALAPFDGDEVEEALRRATEDRDWQVRQAAEDLLAD